jgi:hypothetical protein
MYGGEYIMNQGDADTLFGPFCTWLERDDRYGRTSGLKMASEPDSSPDSSPDSKHLPIQSQQAPLTAAASQFLLALIWRAGQACGEAQDGECYGSMAREDIRA